MFAAEFPGVTCAEPGGLPHALCIPELGKDSEIGVVRRAPLKNLPLKSNSSRAYPNLIRYVGPPIPRFCVSLAGSFTSYFGKFSAKTQSTLRRKLRKLTEMAGGEVECREYHTPQEVAEFCELSRRVPIGDYAQRVLRTEIWPHREKLALHANHAGARCYILFAAQKPIAYLACYLEGKTVVHWISAYDPAYAPYSPGVLLQVSALEKLFAEDCFELFDFMTGDGQHKEFFATENLEVADVYYFRRSVRNSMIVAGHKAFCGATKHGSRVFRAMKLDPYWRRLRRRIATTPRGMEFWRRHLD